MHDEDSSANWAAEAAAVSKLAKIHLETRGKLRDELSRSLTKNIDESREKIVDEATEKISNTFKRQLDLCVQVERELVLNLNGVLTSRHEMFLPPSKPWDLELHPRSVCKGNDASASSLAVERDGPFRLSLSAPLRWQWT